MKTLLDWLQEEPFTLALSSSFFGFFSHCGFAAAVAEQGIKPSKITGSSAGGLIGAALASGLTPLDIRDILYAVERHHFWDPGLGFGLLRGRKFLNFVRQHMAPSFADLQFPVELAAFDMGARKTVFLHEGPLPEAVVATCAVPLMFHPVRIGRRFYFDGGVFLKSGMNLAKASERILCVYLENDGLAALYERRQTMGSLSEHHKVLRFRSLPRVSPFALSNGKLAFEDVYRRGLKAFSLGCEAQLIDA